jgi:hypothetical protein
MSLVLSKGHETSDSSLRVWVEEYNLIKSDAMDKLLDACE